MSATERSPARGSYGGGLADEIGGGCGGEPQKERAEDGVK